MSANPPSADARRRAATEQAAAWLVALQEARLTAKERGEFVDWLRESPLHIAEMLKLSQVDRALEGFARWGKIPTAEALADNVVPLIAGTPYSAPRRPRVGSVLRVLAAGIAVVAIAVGMWFSLNERSTVVRTQLAERRELTLGDGSVVTVAPVSEVRIRFRRDLRSVDLLKGHALFRVAKDQGRPFVVRVGETTVRAVGTSFDVERAAASVRVTVVEGRVLVARHDSEKGGRTAVPAAAPDQVLVAANEEVIVPDGAPMLAVRRVNAAAQVTWVTGTLVFEDETVAEVVRRFNLHNRAQLEIRDSRLADRHISGTFMASDPESFVDFILATDAGAAGDRPAIVLDRPH